MDIATLLGLLSGAAVLVHTVMRRSAEVYDGYCLLLVIGGGAAFTLVAHRLQEVAGIFGVLRRALVPRTPSHRDRVDQIVGFAETARRQGILALEEEVRGPCDPFLTTGIRLAVDGVEPVLVQAILETELSFIEARHRRNQDLVKTLGVNWMIFGVIGALVAIVLLPGGGADALELVSRAGLPLLYGLVPGALFALALRRKLEIHSEEEVLNKRMSMEGVISIQSGDNPRIVAQKLDVFMAPRKRADRRRRDEAGTRPTPAPKSPAEPPLDERLVTRVRDAMSVMLAGLPEAVRARQESLALADLLPLLSDEDRLRVAHALDEPAPEGGPAVGPWTFVFEDIAKLTDREIQLLLREVETKELATALIGANAELRERMFSNVSRRVGAMIKEEMAHTPRKKPRDVLNAQLHMVDILRKLQGAGQVAMGGRDG